MPNPSLARRAGPTPMDLEKGLTARWRAALARNTTADARNVARDTPEQDGTQEMRQGGQHKPYAVIAWGVMASLAFVGVAKLLGCLDSLLAWYLALGVMVVGYAGWVAVQLSSTEGLGTGMWRGI
ncbi:hypothetical protein F4780DRAFT_16504 [Xylariomycetidae sp. FL0641]|nr:hypothetical protein F4780DRAFT_16504 [Xylariomycetidae sp. FL0641]